MVTLAEASLMSCSAAPVGLPDCISCIRCSAAILYIDRLKYFATCTESIQLELNGCGVCICQHSNSADCVFSVVCIHIQGVDKQFKKSCHIFNVLLSDAAGCVESEHDV